MDAPVQQPPLRRYDRDLERLGDTPGFGWLLLEILSLNGWTVRVETGFAGQPTVIATHPALGLPVERLGRVEDVAVEVFKEAASYRRITSARDMQMRLH